jgi:HAMP domain-containing protein
MELAEEIDHFLDRMKEQTGDDYGLLVEKGFLDEGEWAGVRARAGKRNNWGDRTRTLVVDVTGDDESIVDFDGDLSAVPDEGRLLEETERNGRVLARGIMSVKDAAGRRAGGLFVVHDVTDLRETTLEARRSIVWIVVGVSVAFAVFLLLLVNRMVFARLGRMTARMEDLSARLAGGDYAVEMPAPESRDEIGRFEHFFGRFLAVVTGLLKELGAKKAG